MKDDSNNGNDSGSCSCHLCQGSSSSRTNDGTVVIANRGTGNISILDEVTGELIRTVDLPAGEGENQPDPLYVYGIEFSNDGSVIYTTNLPSGVPGTGENGLFVIDPLTNEIIRDVDTAAPGPHNVWLNGDNSRLFLTHSGAEASTVDIFNVEDPTNPILIETTEAEGINPCPVK